MTDHEFDRTLATWLNASAPAAAPPHVHADAMARAARSLQRPAWLVAVRDRIFVPGLAAPSISRRAAWVMVVLALIVAIGVALLAVGSFWKDPLGPLGRNGSIAYAVAGTGVGSDVAHLLTADGTSDAEIGQGTCPRYSGDGRILTWRTGWRDTARVLIAAPDGTGQVEVPGINDAEYALSPDGMLVAWLKGQSELWVASVDGSAPRQIATAESQWFHKPTWSPDGNWIAVAVMRQPRTGTGEVISTYRLAIDAVSADGAQRRRLTSRIGTDNVALSWSPDGRRLAFVGIPDASLIPTPTAGAGLPEGFYPPLDVFVVNADGTGERSITTTPGEEFDPRWSPDGERLAFIAFDEGAGYLLIVGRPDQTTFTEHRGPSAFDWSPDGTRFVYVELINSSGPGVWVKTIDSAFAEPPQTVGEISTDLHCPPSWQRLDP